VIYGSAYIGNDFAIDINSVERIEIVRGPSSVLYGTSAMLAIVNIVTKEVKEDVNIISGSLGSYNDYQAAFTLGRKFGANGSVLFSGKIGDIKGQSLYYNEYDTDSTNKGVAENLDWEKFYGFNLQAKYNEFTFNGFLSTRKKAVPTAAFETNFNDPSMFTFDRIGLLDLKYDNKLTPDKNIMGRIFFDYANYYGDWPYELIQSDKVNGISYGAETQFIWDIFVNYRFVTGLEYRKITKAEYINRDDSNEYFNGNFPYSIFGVFLNNEYQPVEDIRLNLGLRLDNYSNIGTMVTPRISAIIYPFSSSTLKLLYGQAYRAPNVYEFNFMDPVSGFLGNPDLNAEKINTMEICWEEKIGKSLFATVSLYNYQMADIIEHVYKTADSTYQFENVGKIKANGVEFQLDYRPQDGLSAYVSYSFQKARNSSDDSGVSNSPDHLFKLGVSAPLISNLYMAANINYESERKTVYNTKTKNFLLVNTNLHYSKLFNLFNVSAGINNLLNITYKHPGGYEHLQPAIIQNGRNYIITIQMNF
jgi:iron complex outermembrane receptor protein